MAALETRLVWRSESASHLDRLILPDNAFLADGRWAKAAGSARCDGMAILDAEPWTQPAGLDPAEFPASHFRMRIAPVPGRFYPRATFADLSRGPRDMWPVRLLAATENMIRVDPNHPLAGSKARLELCSTDLQPAAGIRMRELFEGPGLQRPPADPGCAYWQLDGFARQDEASDARFYEQPRFTHHLDAACSGEISRLYGRFLAPGQSVLDLMSSWISHLPEIPFDTHVAGLGMNRDELVANPRLSERVVKDLNERADLPWGDDCFDLVICTASIEYLLRPREVMGEVCRVLKPGGVCVVTFSDRWFPTKAIRVWSELHAFERLGMVTSLFQAAGFAEIVTETLRGLKRPEDDKYADQRAFADPLFAVWGVRPG
jgi:SAM-dependent methyltransferase